MGGKGGSETQETVTTSEPPAYVKPYIQAGLSEGQRLYNTSPLYTGQTFNPDEQSGISMMRAQALGDQLQGPASDYTRSVIGGDYLTPDAIGEASAPFVQDFLGGHNRAWEGAGGTGGSLEAEAAGRGIANVVAQQYGAERGLQQQAAQMAPAMDAAGYAPAQAMWNLGGMQQQRIQQYQQEPWDRLARYTGIALGNAPAQLAGGTGVQQTPIHQPSPLQNILGLGLAGAGAASGLGWRPFSDRRLKTNIRRVGTWRGYPWYAFHYVWGEASQGVMADEVNADAVIMDPSGYARVDYSRIA